jgi:hypothetical protein
VKLLCDVASQKARTYGLGISDKQLIESWTVAARNATWGMFWENCFEEESKLPMPRDSTIGDVILN